VVKSRAGSSVLVGTHGKTEQGWIFFVFFFLGGGVFIVLGYVVFVYFSLLPQTKSKMSPFFVSEVVFSAV